jgi:hypothetical protein
LLSTNGAVLVLRPEIADPETVMPPEIFEMVAPAGDVLESVSVP